LYTHVRNSNLISILVANLFWLTLIKAAELFNWDKQIEWSSLSDLKAQLKFYLYELIVSRRFNILLSNQLIYDKKTWNSDIIICLIFKL
jgi:hypothetical protein